MLILRRKSGESIVIGDNIVVTTLDINEGSVRLAIDAPKAIPILRSELLQAADANRDSAATGQSRSQDLLRFLGGKSGTERIRPKAVRPASANRRSSAPTASAGDNERVKSQEGEPGQTVKPQDGEPGQAAKPQGGETEPANPQNGQIGQAANPQKAEIE